MFGRFWYILIGALRFGPVDYDDPDINKENGRYEKQAVGDLLNPHILGTFEGLFWIERRLFTGRQRGRRIIRYAYPHIVVIIHEPFAHVETGHEWKDE